MNDLTPYHGTGAIVQGTPLSPFRIDGKSDKDHVSPVKRWLSLVLLLGAMLGLLAQEAAFASAPAMPMASETTISTPAMSDECAEMMGIDTSDDSAPCKGLTLDCIAKMGCALPPVVVSPPIPFAAAAPLPDLLGSHPIQRLDGLAVGPELDPPLILG